MFKMAKGLLILQWILAITRNPWLFVWQLRSKCTKRTGFISKEWQLAALRSFDPDSSLSLADMRHTVNYLESQMKKTSPKIKKNVKNVKTW